MPIYEYECEKCKKQEEVAQKIDEPAPVCCGMPMKRLISLTKFVLVGGGWAAEGYSNSAKKL